MPVSADWFQRYKFRQPLIQGGMGTIYLAEDKVNNVQCVIKQLTNKYSAKADLDEAIRLFKREAAILRKLHHPGVVHMFDDYATDDGRYFLVMDFVEGKTLETLVKANGPFNMDDAIGIAIQCCEVLEYLHSQDPPIIYRDLKPSNLILTPDGRLVFIDFGIARVFMPKQVATRVVTAGYSPPEQYSGKPETRSDLYSLGTTICHLVTGVRPKPLALCTPALTNANVLTSLDILVRTLTAPSVDDRPPNAQAVRFELYKIYKEIHPEFIIPANVMLYASMQVQKQVKTNAAINIMPLAKFRAAGYQLNNQVRNKKEVVIEQNGDIFGSFLALIKQLFKV